MRLYALLKGFQIQFVECPYSREGYRHQVQEMINEFENKYKGTKQGIVNSFLDILPLLQETNKKDSLPSVVKEIMPSAHTQKAAENVRYFVESAGKRQIKKRAIGVPNEGDHKK